MVGTSARLFQTVPLRGRRMTNPSVGIIIPTLNAERVLEACLGSIAEQDFPRDRLSIFIADAGSQDRTLAIADMFREQGLSLRVIPNPLKTGEAGKFAGLQACTADLVALIDSDNILPDPGWLTAMVRPFEEDDAIIASEPLAYTYRRKDSYINRYCALLGMNDPLCLFIGNYDRMCLVTNRWTGLPVIQEDRDTYLRVVLRDRLIPTMGANGFLIRREVLRDLCPGPYLFDVDVLQDAVRKAGSIAIAKVKTGIVHLYCSNYQTFIRKQKRRILDYLRHRGHERAPDAWSASRMTGLLLFILSTLTILPLFLQSGIGFYRQRDVCWLFHPPACWTTLFVYGWHSLKAFTGNRTDMPREHWSQ
jgi:glycosyltransferase involved in cell wall biosynthesis